MSIAEALVAIAPSFATIVSLASAFSTGRDVNHNTSLIEFQNWLVENGHQNLSDEIASSRSTGIYIKALLNQQLPLIIEAINELKSQSVDLPVKMQSLLGVHSEVLLQALDRLEQKISVASHTQYNQQTSSGDRSPNVAHHGNGDISVKTGDMIHTQINHYGISIDDHKKALEERELEVREELSRTNASDQLYRELLEKEYAAIKERLENLERSYQEELASRAEAEKTLKDIKDKLPQFQSDAALKKFNEGEKGAAKELFDKVIEQAEKSNELAGQAAYENGRMAQQEIRYLEAREYYQKAVRFQPDNSTFNNALGSILHDLGQYAKAIEYYQLALASDLKAYGEDHPQVAIRRNNLGGAYKSLGQYAKAIEYYQLALASGLKTYGEDHPQVAIRRNNLGGAYKSLGQYAKAIEYYQLALASDLKTYGEDHPNVATYRNNLGLVCKSLGQYAKAIEYYQLALASGLKTYGEDHPSVAIDRNNLGGAYHSLGQYAKAIEYYQLALASDLKTYGEDHPCVAIDHNNLGGAYKSLGHYEKAIEYYQLALASDLKTYGEDHPQVATYRNNLGMAYKSLGQYAKAIEYYQLALASDLKTYEEDHPQVAIRRHNIGGAYHSLGQYAKAIEYYQLALASGLKTYGEDHPNVAIDRNNLGLAYHSLGLYEKATEYYQLALKTSEAMLGKEHPNTKVVTENLRLAQEQLK